MATSEKQVDPLYEYLTKPDNFKAAQEIVDNWKAVKNWVIDGFWEEVSAAADSQLPAGWNLVLQPRGTGNRKLYAWHVATGKEGRIVFEDLEKELQLGVWFDQNVFSKEQIVEIYEQAQLEKDNLWEVGNTKEWFALYKDCGLNFGNDHQLNEFLPDTRSTQVRSFAKDLVEAIEQWGEFSIRIVQRYRQPSK